jgi:hypothetical protein
LVYLAALICIVAGCDSSSTPSADVDAQVMPGSDAGDLGPVDGGVTDRGIDGPISDADSGAGKCTAGASSCESKTQQRVCKDVGGQLDWVVESCPSGTLCLDHACSADCIDRCNLGETRDVAGKTETCKLYSVQKDDFVALSGGLHDRARQYNAWLREHHLPGGTVADAYFTDAGHTQVAAWHGVGDSAIWTGSYLAGEALRLEVTGSPDAEKNVEQLVEAIHRLFQVNGHVGYLSRWTSPLNDPDPRIAGIYDPNSPKQHVSKYDGQDYFWLGDVSRDQYQGVLLGYALAYEALTSATHKQMIRQDMVDLCSELLKERKQVPVTVRFHALGQWHEQTVNLDLQYVVLNPSEYKGSGPYIQIGAESDPTAYGESSMVGFREFWPDYAKVLKQIPLLGALIVFPVPRSGSAIMLASILRIGMLVTEGVAGYSAQHAAFKQHYDQQINTWLGIMKLYTYFNAGPPNCWSSYYGLNIVFEPVYNLVRLEDNATLRTSFQKEVLEGKMWPFVKDHKNVFFSYIHASQAPSGTVQAVINAANTQLGQFPPPPHAHVAVDNTGKYPASAGCPGLSSVATDVKDRTASDFIWQRQPFNLKTAGDPKKVYPGVDFMLPYWMARHHQFLNDDAAGTCLRWSP